jgi:putative hydrolase of the HAD superfamily
MHEFVAHHNLRADAVLTSHAHGKTKPHESIFRAMLDLLGVAPPEAVMVGDTVDDDVEGALAVGMQAVLLDREGRYPEIAGRLDDLRELPVVLGLGATD